MSKRKEQARAKKLKDTPARTHNIYKAAWRGKSRKKAIRAFCLECMQWLSPEVTRCTSVACPLYEYRLS